MMQIIRLAGLAIGLLFLMHTLVRGPSLHQGKLSDGTRSPRKVLQDRVNDKSGVLETEPLKSVGLRTPRRSSMSDQQEETDCLQTSAEAKRLLERSKEIVSLMHKDYSGMSKPRRKPPINNNEPWH